MTTDAPALHDVRYAAARLGIPVSAVYHLVHKKQITFVKLGLGLKRSPVRFTDEDLDRFIASRRVTAADEGVRDAARRDVERVHVSEHRRRRNARVLAMPGAARYA